MTVAAALVKPFDEAVMVMVPSALVVAVAVTTPAETVAIVVLLDTHVATAVMSCPPLHEAVKAKLAVLGVREALVGFMIGALVQATATVRGWVPVIDGRLLEAAVIVPVPVDCAVTSPPEEMVATAEPPVPVPEMVQVTGVVPLEPSLNVPTANIWTVSLTVPAKIVGETGPIAREVRVGFTKNPLQLMASARVASAAKAPISRILCFVDDIFLETPWARALTSWWCFKPLIPAKIVAEMIPPGAH